jgi:hypothetical protein
MTNNPFILAAIKFTEVEIRMTFEMNQYDPNDNVISLNLLNGTTIGEGIRSWLGRPPGKDFSLAHELGHAIYETCAYDTVPAFRKLFGNSHRTGTELRAMVAWRNGKPGAEYISTYAEYDSEEDFAECVGFMCSWKNKIPKSVKNKKLLAKLVFVQDVLNEVLDWAG